MRNNKQKSFTLIEMLVTISIIVILSVITFGIYGAYRNSATLDLATQDLHDVILSTRNMAYAPNDPTAENYILIINTDPNNTRTPHAQAYIKSDAGAHSDDCLHLAPNGGYCIQKEITDGPIQPILGGDRTDDLGEVGAEGFCPPSTLTLNPFNYYRANIARGKLNLSGGTISAPDLVSGSQHWPDEHSLSECGPEGDCGDTIEIPPGVTAWSGFCEHEAETGCNTSTGDDCAWINEDKIVKIHFRVWDGAIGINGVYNDLNAAAWTYPENASFTFAYGDKTKTLTINLYSGAVRIQ